jgi:hypothetical protein
MGEVFEKKNQVHFYVREEYKEAYNLFCKLIKKDKRLDKFMTSKKIGRFSIAICQLMAKYIEGNPDLLKSKEEKEPLEEKDVKEK